METAVNLLLDGAPLIGEKVVILGQGIIGLLTTALLARFPLTTLSTLDTHPLRRSASIGMGASESVAPDDPDAIARLGAVPGQGGGADLVYELSGNPAALNTALSLARFSGRVVIGSWYGAKTAELDLGGVFHRGRISIISSQVSRIAPELTGRWQNKRRMDLAWQMLRQVRRPGASPTGFRRMMPLQPMPWLTAARNRRFRSSLITRAVANCETTQGEKTMYHLGAARKFNARHYLVGGDWGDENIEHSHCYHMELILEKKAWTATDFWWTLSRWNAIWTRWWQTSRTRPSTPLMPLPASTPASNNWPPYCTKFSANGLNHFTWKP